MNLTHVAFTLVMLLYNVQTQLGKEKLFLHCMNEITKKPDKATSFQPKFNTKLEKDKHTSARMGHSLCYYLPKWSLWGEIMVYLKLNEVTFPWNVSLTRKLLCLKKSSDSVTLCRKMSLPHKWPVFVLRSFKRKENLAPTSLFLKTSISEAPRSLGHCFPHFIDFLSWHTLSLTALIITYIRMIFKFALHFQPFQIMSPFASPQIWLMSCLGWATILSDWIWMRWRLCSLVVNKL